MLGQPASSQTVCSPSRRTRDLSSVYSGPVLRRVLIHSGLRSIGTWLLRTSRRGSLRPAGSSGDPVAGVGTTGSLLLSPVPVNARRPRCEQRGRRPNEDRGSGPDADGGLVAGALDVLATGGAARGAGALD